MRRNPRGEEDYGNPKVCSGAIGADRQLEKVRGQNRGAVVASKSDGGWSRYGGENCAAQTRRRLTSVELIRNWDLIEEFEGSPGSAHSVSTQRGNLELLMKVLRVF